MKHFGLIIAAFLISACAGAADPSTGNTPKNTAEPAKAEAFSTVERPDSVKDKMKARGDQDEAKPTLTVTSPKEGEVITSSAVKVKVTVDGGLKMGKDDAGTGNHVHVILDNQPYAAHYEWNEGFELRNVADGEHTLRMFASRPWHESYKNPEAFKTIKFTVKNGNADESKPTTDSDGKKLADAPKPEGANMQSSSAGEVDFSKPLLTYSRPKGEYKGDAAKAIMIDFWLANAKLKADGGDYTVRCTIGQSEPIVIEKWEPIWLTGWGSGDEEIKLELVDKDGKVVENGGYNTTTRKIKLAP